jgi:hypothetical protein
MPNSEPYRGSWRRTSRTVRQLQPECAWCNTSNDLCADHIVPGKPEFGVRTLCRPCNTRRRNGATGPTPHPTR